MILLEVTADSATRMSITSNSRRRFEKEIDRLPTSQDSCAPTVPPEAETVAARELALQRRPSPRKEAEGRIFVTKYSGTFNKDASANPISLEFRRLTRAVNAAQRGTEKHGAEPPAPVTREVIGPTRCSTPSNSSRGGRDQVTWMTIIGTERDDMATCLPQKSTTTDP